MSCLVDTNVLLRLADERSAEHSVARAAVEHLVGRCQVSGKRAHDARLAALMLVHGVRQLVTFNTSDFPRSWGVEAVHPEDVMATRPK